MSQQGHIAAYQALIPGGIDDLAYDLANQKSRLGPKNMARFDDPIRPDVIDKRAWRRMSRMSRAAAVVTAPLVAQHPTLPWSQVPVVWATALGEVVPTSVFLHRLFTEGSKLASPKNFQNGVYNATAGHLSLAFGLQGHCETLSAGMASGLAALYRGIELAESAPCRCALVVVGDTLSDMAQTAYQRMDAAGGEAMVAVLVKRVDAQTPANVQLTDGLAPGSKAMGRRTKMPYESVPPPHTSHPIEAILGCCCTNGLLALLAGCTVIDTDESTHLHGAPIT